MPLRDGFFSTATQTSCCNRIQRSNRVRLLVVSTHDFPDSNRADGTSSLAEGVLGVFTFDDPRGSSCADEAFVVGILGGEKTLHSSTQLPLVRSAMLCGWRIEVTDVCVWYVTVYNLKTVDTDQ